MDFNDIITEIIEKEWKMFHNVNGEERTSCQDDGKMFDAMRRAQFETWSQEALMSYLDDLETAESEGRNIAREKYIRMMKTTEPENYKWFERELPPLSERQKELTEMIWDHLLRQTIRMNEKYPAVARSGRPLLTVEERNGDTSIETYQKGELLTYSADTLQALFEHLIDLEDQGIDIALQIRENTMKNMGFLSLDEAESKLSQQFTS